jgi:hypothetical protein
MLVFDRGFGGQLAQTNATKHKTMNSPMILQSKSILALAVLCPSVLGR